MSNCGCKTQPSNTPCTTCDPIGNCGCTTACACATTQTCGKTSKYSEQKAGPVKILAKHSLTVKSPWVIPAIGQKTMVLVDSTSVANGSQIYSDVYGWFTTGDYDPSNNSLSLLNSFAASTNPVNGLTMNEIGKPVPGCTEFSVGTPSTGVGANTSGQRCLLGSFYSKGVSDGSDPALVMSATLTSIEGISPGDRIFFGVYEYIVKNVFVGNRVDFYNAGAGATAGTLISGGLDCNGNCLLIVTIAGGSSPCDALPVQEVASLIGCNGGVQQPFTSLYDKAIPQWDAESDSWKPAIIAVDTTVCVSITTGFTVTGGDPGPYTIAVSNNSLLNVGDILSVAGRLEYFTITAKPDSTHLIVTVNPTFAGFNDFDCGEIMCKISCCEEMEICPPFASSVFVSLPQTAPEGQGLDAVGTYNIVVGDVTIENENECKSAVFSLTCKFGGAIRLPKPGTWQMNIIVDGVLYYTQLVNTLTADTAAQMNDQSWIVEFSPGTWSTHTLAPGESKTVNVTFQIQTTDSVPSGSSVQGAGVQVWGLVIAI